MVARVAPAGLASLRHAEDTRWLCRHLQRAICQSLLGLAAALEARHPYTCGHSERVGAWSRRLAVALGLAPDQVDIVATAGRLHDLGTIGVPEAVLRTRAPLGPDEWTLVRNHPVIGAQIVAPFEFFAGGALAIRHHHERWDGTGYPDGLVGPAIPLGARIVAVADVFDALTSDRPYRAALSREAALAYLVAEKGRTLDGDVVGALQGLAGLDEPA
jgi:HD-GYP domain-containing protein (c-di-GMP phosphodiesterase class II)